MRGKPETPRRAGALLSAGLAGAIMPLSTAESAALEGALRSRPTLTVLRMYLMTVVGAECTVTVSSVCIAVRYGVFPPCVGPARGHWSAHSRRTRGVEPGVTGTRPFRLGTSDVGLRSLHWSMVVQLRRVWFCCNPLAMTIIYELCYSHSR